MWNGNNMDKLFFINDTVMYISSYNLFRIGLKECTRDDKFKNFHIVSVGSNNANLLTYIANKVLFSNTNNMTGIYVRIHINSRKYALPATLIYMYILTFIRKCICQLFKLLRIQGFRFQCTSKLFYKYLQSPYFFVFINMYV